MQISMTCCTKTPYTKADGRPAAPPTVVVADWTWLHRTCTTCTLHMFILEIYSEYAPNDIGYYSGTHEYLDAYSLDACSDYAPHEIEYYPSTHGYYYSCTGVHRRNALLFVYPLLIFVSLIRTVHCYVKDLREERDELAEQALYLTKVDNSLHVIGGDSEEDV